MPKAKKLQIEAVIQDEETAVEVAKTDAQVSDLELVTNIVAGKLTSNAKEFSAALKNELKNYTVKRYLDNPDAAKTDKVYLNKLKDDVAKKRQLATQTWNKPLEEFSSIMKTLEKDIDSAYSELNSIVNQAAQKEKDEKKAKITEFWNTLDFTVVPLDRVFNPKWLNKTEKLPSIMEECKAIVEKINGEMATLKSLQDEDKETLLSFYLDTLDLNATLQKGNQLKENRARIKAEEERKAAEKAKQEQFPPIDPSKYNVTETGQVVKENLTTQAEQPKEPVATFRLEVTAPASKLVALRKFIDDNGISYRKL
ncbi:MAG: DUF1351 domain-containing protein [Methanobrevibacter sp.]|nr:DUF1351 domain-containing protein [Methanobrevibacter sp.]